MQTLRFLPADGSEPSEQQIPVTVSRRPLPIKIANYEVAYGDEFRRSDITVTAGGYLLEKDLLALNETLQKYDIRWVLADSDGNVIEWPGVPSTRVLASGTIDLKAGVAIRPEDEFPNYAATRELGTWEIIPRTVSVGWQQQDGLWTAVIGNVLPGDEVFASVGPDGTLTLSGAQSGFYQIADRDLTPPPADPAIPSIPGQPAKFPQNETAGSGLPFADVPAGSWYFDGVKYVYANSLMNGTGTDAFSPDATLTRGMLVTILYRMAQEPAVNGGKTFSDVAAGRYYSDAVQWASANGIVEGFADGTFRPEQPVTREQLAAILSRDAALRGQTVPETALPADISASSWAKNAVAWAYTNGILDAAQGTNAAQNATRAEVAMAIYAYLGK